MKLVIQRVSEASVTVDNEVIASIGKGLLVFLGIGKNDTGEEISWLAKKLVDLRIFEDENGKMNLSLTDVQGSILLISQFTLYASCARGKRPDFIEAATPDKAKQLYMEFASELDQLGISPQMGKFAADMKIRLINDGPVTILLEK